MHAGGFSNNLISIPNNFFCLAYFILKSVNSVYYVVSVITRQASCHANENVRLIQPINRPW